ncbi:hypothetical protein [Curtobacterium sp. MCPF17_050]|uniref:hypothetical protein n=1 Tax=Curtobacterium sp. MCPF17_050 TaxID=2175664 RepID=UPI0032E8031C
MIKTAPWYEGTDAEKVRASITAYEDAARAERTASTASLASSTPAESNPWLNASTVQPLEGEEGR